MLLAGTQSYRTLNDRFAPRDYPTLAAWQQRASYLRDHVLASAGLLPLPEKAPLDARVFDEKQRRDYTVSKVHFESLPGFYVTGNLYRPAGTGPFPAILSPHGHWPYGRFENTELTSGPGRAINLARQGFVVFTYDMIGYGDSRQLTHEFGGRRQTLWGLSLSGLQLWNSIRGVDFLASLPYVDRERIGATGESGGGTQTFLLAAVDERIKVAAPVNMISLHMQGGCLCENPPGLRLDTNNVEIASLIAPRPLLMVAATGDWTNETPRLEYPAVRRVYALFNAENRVHSVQIDAPHNYNRASREAMYAWMAQWLQNKPAGVTVAEQPFTPERLNDLLVFDGRSPPAGAVGERELVDAWIAAARQQLQQTDRRVLESALLHSLSLERRPRPQAAAASKIVIAAGTRPEVDAAITKAGFSVRPVRATPFDGDAAAKIAHFETYNRTVASQRVADIVRALDESPGASVVADGDFALPAVLAAAVAPATRVVADVGPFDTASDEAFVERLYIPGIRRAGDLKTAVAMAAGQVHIHNGRGKLSPEEIVDRLRRP